MSDVNCPYCGHKEEINHDDGYGYEEGEDFEQDCSNCEKTYTFTTSISFDYSVYCQGEHEMEPTLASDFYQCEKCDYSEFRR